MAQLSDRLNRLAPSATLAMSQKSSEMKAQGIDVINMSVGEPDFNTPDHIKNAAKEAVDNNYSRYSPVPGYADLRKAIAAKLKRENHLEYNINEILVSNGAKQSVCNTVMALVNDGDEVIIPTPYWVSYPQMVKLAGGNPVHYICDESSGWYPDIEDMEKKITDKTKGIVVINPNNPTGALYPKEILEKIVELARKHELMIFADEIYDRLVLDGKTHTSIASLAPDLFVVTFNGLSKSHRIAGFRSGWMVLSGDLSKAKGYIEGVNMLSSMRLCANVPAQHVIAPALRNRPEVDDLLLPGGRIYEQRKVICDAIAEIDGLSAVTPEAAFYIFPKIDAKRFHILDDEKFALDFLREKHVLLVHGRGFNWEAPDHFRIVYLPEVAVLDECMTKMKEFLADYQQK